MTNFRPPTPLEKAFERDASDLAIRRGWFESKVTWPGHKGLPDRFYARNGRIVLVEYKRDGEPLRRKQLLAHEELRRYGVEVHVLDNMTDARNLFL